KENTATIWIASNPAEADVYVQGELYLTAEHVGQTPPLSPAPGENERAELGWPPQGEDGGAKEPEPNGLKVEVRLGARPSNVKITVEKPRFRRREIDVFLRPNEKTREALIVTLERENIFDFDRRALENRIGMRFVPVREDLELLASVWETRVQDYETFVNSMARKVPVPKGKNSADHAYALFVNTHVGKVTMPPPPGFEQGPSHPVVNVTREDAERFCHWLTLSERKSKEIGREHEYRLPTDEEWSLFAGIQSEFGEWPMER
ncbi:MAG: formylglycine-generating enzyme family protein, partial [Akkermansiaceae bacterium]|nr:formylglycine-generating enzyme family protein [Akkermansiaceae bacterium]